MTKKVEHLPRFQRARDGSFSNLAQNNHCQRSQQFLATTTAAPRRWRESMPAAIRRSLEEDPTNELSRRWDLEYCHHTLQRLQDLVEPEFSATTWGAFRLRVIEQRSTDEVATLLGISKNAVDIAKSRVLNRLRKEALGLIED